MSGDFAGIFAPKMALGHFGRPWSLHGGPMGAQSVHKAYISTLFAPFLSRSEQELGHFFAVFLAGSSSTCPWWEARWRNTRAAQLDIYIYIYNDYIVVQILT